MILLSNGPCCVSTSSTSKESHLQSGNGIDSSQCQLTRLSATVCQGQHEKQGHAITPRAPDAPHAMARPAVGTGSATTRCHARRLVLQPVTRSGRIFQFNIGGAAGGLDSGRWEGVACGRASESSKAP